MDNGQTKCQLHIPVQRGLDCMEAGCAVDKLAGLQRYLKHSKHKLSSAGGKKRNNTASWIYEVINHVGKAGRKDGTAGNKRLQLCCNKDIM